MDMLHSLHAGGVREKVAREGHHGQQRLASQRLFIILAGRARRQPLRSSAMPQSAAQRALAILARIHSAPELQS
jgi:hypothetical protein